MTAPDDERMDTPAVTGTRLPDRAEQVDARDLDATLRDIFQIRRARWRNLTATLGDAAEATGAAMTRFRTAYARKPMTSRPDGRLSA